MQKSINKLINSYLVADKLSVPIGEFYYDYPFYDFISFELSNAV